MNGVSLKTAQNAKGAVTEVFRRLVGEVAVGVVRLTSAGYGLKVNLAHAPEQGVELPVEVSGVPVQVEVTGRIVKR